MKTFDIVGSEADLWKRVLSNVDREFFGVEIGCLFGDSAHLILGCSPKIYLISIDPIIPDSMEKSLIGDLESILEKNKEYILQKRFELIQDFSWNKVNTFEDQSLDFIFIDGDHTYNSVLRDYNEWEPKIKVGGFLFMHDSRMSRPNGARFHDGPSKVAETKVFNNPDKWEIVDEAFSLTCARKRI